MKELIRRSKLPENPYNMGCQAYLIKDQECPFGKGQPGVTEWWKGYYASRINDRLSHIFSKYDMAQE